MLKKRYHQWKEKKLSAKISDIVFVLLIVAILIPSSRIEVVGFIHRLKAKIIQPTIKKESRQDQLSENDYNYDLIALNKGRINLKEYKGKVIFLNFWATWCPPCVGELPEIQKMYNKFSDNKNVVFILISNEEPEVIEAFLEKKDYHLPAFLALEASPEIFQTRTIPTSFLISKTGRIVVKEKGAVHWGGDKMEKIINELILE